MQPTYQNYRHIPSVLESLDQFNDAMFYTQALDCVDIPDKFDEAWNHPNIEERKRWWQGIKKEVGDIIDRDVWNLHKLKDVPKHCCLVGVRWCWHKKRDGRFRPRIVFFTLHVLIGGLYVVWSIIVFLLILV